MLFSDSTVSAANATVWIKAQDIFRETYYGWYIHVEVLKKNMQE